VVALVRRGCSRAALGVVLGSANVSTERPTDDERRQYPRVAAPMYCRPARRRLLRRRKVVDVGLGGMRVYSDDAYEPGERLEIDLLTADGDDFVTVLTEVVWIREVAGSSPAAFDVGLRFLEIPPAAKAMIEDLVTRALAREGQRAP
jgi:c-di-GMP-binding flagellar brake protein YcgR